MTFQYRPERLYVDVSGSTSRIWGEHKDQIREAATAFRHKRMFSSGVYPWCVPVPTGYQGGTGVAAVCADVANTRGMASVIIVTDDTLALRTQMQDEIAKQGLDWIKWSVVSFAEFANLPIETPTGLLGAIMDLEYEYERVLAEGSQLTRNRVAMEIHQKLRRAADVLRGQRTQHPSHATVEESRQRLHRLTERLLKDVFQLEAPEGKDILHLDEEGPMPKRTVDGITGLFLKAGKTFANDDYASVEITLNDRTVEGHAKRDPHDKPDQALGLTLATGRALRKMGGQLINEANQAVAAADKARRAEEAKKHQARADQRKAEAAARRKARLVEEVTQNHERLQEQQRSIEVLKAAVNRLHEEKAEMLRKEAARKARARKATKTTAKKR